MCKLFDNLAPEIKQYCVLNDLSFEKAKTLAKCWGKNDLWLQYHDPEKGKKGLLDETPAPVILKIFKTETGVTFEQTEYTQKYLAN